MAITLRINKGSELTFAELDENFTDLDTRINTLEGVSNTDNQTLTLVGNNLSISGGNTVDLSGLGGSGVALTDLSVTVAAAGNANLTYDNATGAFTYTPPDLSSYSTFDGDYNSLTNKPTIPSALTDLGINDGTNGQVLTTDGAGNFTFTTVTSGSSYADSDVDTHLNTSTATANQVLSWDGADYAWVADQTGSGGLANIVEDTTPQLGGALDTNGNNITGTGNLTIQNWMAAYDGFLTIANGGDTVPGPIQIVASANLDLTSGSNNDINMSPHGSGRVKVGSVASGIVEAANFMGHADQFMYLSSKTTGAESTHIALNSTSGVQTTMYGAVDFVSGGSVDFTGSTVTGLSTGASVTVQDAAPGSGSTGDLWWESDVGVLKIYYGGTWVDASPAGSSSGGIALTDLSVTVASAGSANLTYDNTTGAFTYTPPDLSSYLTSYTETDTLDSVVGRGATTTTTAVIPFYYANQAAFPNATTYHGAIAHSHADGAMFFAHSGTWNQLANSTDLDFNNLTNQNDAYKVNIQTASLAQSHYPLMHSAISGTGITPLIDPDYRYNPDTNTLSVTNLDVATGITAPTINPASDAINPIGAELVINGGDATALNSQGGDLTLDAGAGANLPGEINLGVNSSNTGQINIGYSGSVIVVDGRTTFNGDVTLTTGTWETVNTSITTGAATVNVDCDSGHIVYLDASGGAFNSTFTINLVNLGNTSNVATAVTVIIKQPTGSGVLPNAIQIGGTGQTLLWQGGSAPTPNAGGNAHDVFTFSVLDLGATNVVLGQMVDYA